MGNTLFEWGPKEQAMFDELKHLIASEEVTAQPRPIGKFQLEVDASGYALGGVLSQLQDDKWRSVAFILHTMTDAKLNYDIYDKELLTIMCALKEWHPYLLDTCKTFEIWTDHKNLSYFRKAQDLNSRQAHWYLILIIHSTTSPEHQTLKLTSYPDYLGIRSEPLRRPLLPCYLTNISSTKLGRRLYCSRSNNSVREVHCWLIQSNQPIFSPIFEIRSKTIIEEKP